MLKTTVVGNYPKLPADRSDVNIRRQLHRFDRGQISQAELEGSMVTVTRRVLAEQLEAGIHLPTDGQIRWDDIVTPIAGGADGFEIDGLIRWFNNNVYYRKPQIVSQIRWTKPITVAGYELARSAAAGEIKAVLPGPFSLVELCDNQHYQDYDLLLADAADLLRQETEALIAAGARQIQFDEPALQYHPKRIDTAAAAVNRIVEGLPGVFWLCFYFGRVAEIVARSESFKVQVLAADCVSYPENIESLLALEGGCNACFGLLDARNIKMEKADDLKQRYRKIAQRFPDAYISPSCGLEFLPHINAKDKVTLLGATVTQFNRGL